MRKGVLLLSILSFITIVSSYGEQGGTFIGNYFIDTNMIAAAITFVVIFWAISFGTSKLHMFGSKSVQILISIILSLFSIYGLAKMGISFEKVFKNFGLDQIIQIYFPHIITAIAIICMIIWGIGVVLMTLGGIFIILGVIASSNPEFIYNWELLIIMGTILFIIGIIIRKKKDSKNKWAYNTGRAIGKTIGWTGKQLYNTGKWAARGPNRGLTNLENKWQSRAERKKAKKEFDKKSKRIQSLKETRKRTKKELQEKYNYYSKLIRQLMRQNNGIIPGFDKNSPTPGLGWERHKYIQAMIAIENLARQQGVKLDNEGWYKKVLSKSTKAARVTTKKSIRLARETLNKSKILLQKTGQGISTLGTYLNKKTNEAKNSIKQDINQAVDNINQRIKYRKSKTKETIDKKYNSITEEINSLANDQNERLNEEQEISTYEKAHYIAGHTTERAIRKTEQAVREKLIQASEFIGDESEKIIKEAKKLSDKAKNQIIDSYEEIKNYFIKKSRKKETSKYTLKLIERYQKEIRKIMEDRSKLEWELKKHEQYALKGVESSINRIEEINREFEQLDKEIIKIQNKIEQIK